MVCVSVCLYACVCLWNKLRILSKTKYSAEMYLESASEMSVIEFNTFHLAEIFII